MKLKLTNYENLTLFKQMNLIELIMIMKNKKTRNMSKHMIIERKLKEKMNEKENEYKNNKNNN